jgi:hypothetical protein
MPDISELPELFGGFCTINPEKVGEYKTWFTDAAALVMSKLPDRAHVIFLQSDVRVINTAGEVRMANFRSVLYRSIEYYETFAR